MQECVLEEAGGTEDDELGLQRPGCAHIGRTWAGHGRPVVAGVALLPMAWPRTDGAGRDGDCIGQEEAL